MKSTRLVFAILFVMSFANAAAVAWTYSNMVENDHAIIEGLGRVIIDHAKRLDNKADRTYL